MVENKQNNAKAKLLLIGIALVAGLALAYGWLAPSKQAASGLPIVEVKVPQLSDKATIGEVAFSENCAACHGKNAAGQNGVAPPLIHIIYEPSHHGDQAFYLAAKNGVRGHHWPFGNMPPVDNITDQEIADITYYIRELQRANGIN